MLFAGFRAVRARPAGRPSTLVALDSAATAGAVVWGVLPRLIHRQLSLEAWDTLPLIGSHLDIVLRAYPSNVGALGVLFYLIAAYSAVSVPLRSRKLASDCGPAETAGPPAASPAAGPDG
jgi:hypothetical protein